MTHHHLRRRHRLAALLLVPAVVLTLGACGSDDEDGDGASATTASTVAETTSELDTSTTTTTGAPSTTTTTTTAPGGSPTTSTTVPAFGGDTAPKAGEADGEGTAPLVDVRTGRHPGFDRVVLEFAGGVQPGWDVQWVEGPVTESGSGREVEVDGPALLRIHVAPASGYDLEAGEATFAAERVAGPGGGPVHEVVRAGDFEADLVWVVGAEAETPFTVTTLPSPSRLVVDVAAP
ncbi:hypothetical protein PO878_13575 [Iamia majanohamensis]|uniref:AMIN-like domain-containing protein n=1 Tax=Iamia majanohamensis TaxID=467976 RepID=A0AAF0BU12_9ACTN|nr:hypothetical protein [Iamia majanohamensis]WCO65528.1 hypothetical protein PO878_13575 [Iamia majanohamensis]